MPAVALLSPSAIRPAPTVRMAIAITGRITGHGWFDDMQCKELGQIVGLTVHAATDGVKPRDNWLVTLTKRVYTPLLAFGLRFALSDEL